ncbi:hypothetical protein ACGFI4_06380 [Micromonospora carbonacea]|uniref:DUF1622 domain-containing protein n=1 Tax=Micromonospora carbonacea TaxID=47853 RepID=A0A1C5AJS6_9ACTN|nr:hypothetical protein [Micromonospora carbonacea]MBB5826441.1 hypothetical protein [Micromonospora carbonacea]QLD25965.1 hypothetical protein HXZ27_18540 [Micromonospora carbonacea]SCF45470.1 hypothetical protein GA0070563_113173 [Micromonospora carbonacea]
MTAPLPSVVTAVALLVGLATLAATGSWRRALRVLLDLLTAAGLLRLTGDQGWTQLAGAAAIVAVRTALWRVVVATTPPGGTGRSAVRRGRARCGADDHALP